MNEPTATGQLSPRRLRRLLKEYAKALREDPGNLVLRLKLAFVLKELGRSDEAVDMYRTIAVAYAQSGRLVQAMAVCKGILEIDPEHSETQALLAELAESQGARQGTGTIRIQEVGGRWVAVPAPVGDPEATGSAGDSGQITAVRPPDEGDEAPQSAPRGAGHRPGAPSPGVGEPAALPPLPGLPDQLAPPLEVPQVPSHLFGPDGTRGDIDSDVLTRPGRWMPLGLEPVHHDSLPSRAIRSQVVNEAETILARPSAPAMRRVAAAAAGDVGGASSPKKPRLAPQKIVPAEEEISPDEIDSQLDPFDLDESKVLEALSTPMPVAVHAADVVPVPLLSALPREAFVEFLRNVSVRQAAPGTIILREGAPGDAFYVVVGGHVRVLKDQEQGLPLEVARLGPGAFFGEFALLADQVRHASVEAVDEVELLEVSRELLDDLSDRFPEVGRTVRRFYRQRLIETLMATAPFFEPLSPDERGNVAGKLRCKRFSSGAPIVTEGGRPGGLYLVLLGQVEVTRRRPDGEMVVVARLGEGSYFGEISLLSGGAPPVATVTAAKDSEIVELPPSAFYELMAGHPELWNQVKREAERRQEAADALLSGVARHSKPEVYLL